MGFTMPSWSMVTIVSLIALASPACSGDDTRSEAGDSATTSTNESPSRAPTSAASTPRATPSTTAPDLSALAPPPEIDIACGLRTPWAEPTEPPRGILGREQTGPETLAPIADLNGPLLGEPTGVTLIWSESAFDGTSRLVFLDVDSGDVATVSGPPVGIEPSTATTDEPAGVHLAVLSSGIVAMSDQTVWWYPRANLTDPSPLGVEIGEGVRDVLHDPRADIAWLTVRSGDLTFVAARIDGATGTETGPFAPAPRPTVHDGALIFRLPPNETTSLGDEGDVVRWNPTDDTCSVIEVDAECTQLSPALRSDYDCTSGRVERRADGREFLATPITDLLIDPVGGSRSGPANRELFDAATGELANTTIRHGLVAWADNGWMVAFNADGFVGLSPGDEPIADRLVLRSAPITDIGLLGQHVFSIEAVTTDTLTTTR